MNKYNLEGYELMDYVANELSKDLNEKVVYVARVFNSGMSVEISINDKMVEVKKFTDYEEFEEYLLNILSNLESKNDTQVKAIEKLMSAELGHTVEYEVSDFAEGKEVKIFLEGIQIEHHQFEDIREYEHYLIRVLANLEANTLARIKEEVRKNGGATLDSNLKPLESKEGYMVSLEGLEEVTTLEDFNYEMLERYMDLAKKKVVGYIGLWMDGDKLYLDISKQYFDLEIAKTIGEYNNQLAIYDLKNEKAISIK